MLALPTQSVCTGSSGRTGARADCTGSSSDQDLWIEIHHQWPVPPAFLPDLNALGVELLERSQVLRIEGLPTHLTDADLHCLHEPLVEHLSIGSRSSLGTSPMLDVFCRPGVTDTEGEMAALALHEAGLSSTACHAGARFRFAGPVAEHSRLAVERAVGNDLIQVFHWHDHELEGMPARDEEYAPTLVVELRDVDDFQLAEISQECSLSLDTLEMQTIAAHFRTLDRPPTDVELQTIALAWSEHCCHKTFKARIEFEHNGQKSLIFGLLAECFVAPTQQLNRAWVRSAFADNAGVIAFDDTHDLALKVETHNHPSALEPYGGAHTGVGGVIRDILAVSAEPIANTNVLCFGPLDLPERQVPVGAFHPQRTFREVVRGIADYGNNMGIPTVGGAVLFHPGYTTNPLVYCGTLGLVPTEAHPREPQPGDAVVVLGGRTGRDGLHGATMSSVTLDRETVESSTVQIGAPITEKLLRDVLPHLRDARLYHAITDCGAGGLCSAVGEMGEKLGVDVELALVPLKYPGLSPWEIWLSEAQERIVLAVPPNCQERVAAECRALGVETTIIGTFRDDGRLRLTFRGEPVADLDMSFVHDGRPDTARSASWNDSPPPHYQARDDIDASTALLRLLAHPNIASKEEVIRRYDHEVGGATVIKPLVGNGGASDAAVLQPIEGSWSGAVLAHGISPQFTEHDPYAMAMLAVDEALRNLVAVGSSISHAALLDNFCWGDVDEPEALGSLVRAAQGCRDAALAYGVPFISGKDSLRNTSVDRAGSHSIPGTLLITALGVVPDVRQCVTMELKEVGSRLYLLGNTADELGGSHYLALAGVNAGTIPQATPVQTATLMRQLTLAIQKGLVLSCHDLSEGGLAVAAAEMALAGTRGMTIDLDRVPPTTGSVEALLFSESAGRFLVEVPVKLASDFEALFDGLPCGAVGSTVAEDRFVLTHRGQSIIDLGVAELDRTWKNTLSATSDKGTSATHAPSHMRATPIPEPATAARPGRRTNTRPSVLVLAAAGVNCDRETAEACRLAGGEPEIVHLNQLVAGQRCLDDFSMLVLPGGFSYGDHLGAGAMLATVLRHRLLDQLETMVAEGRPILGICNGFQTLCRLGLLGPLSLVSNAHGLFECRWVELQVVPSVCFFLDGLDRIALPIAHGEGRLVASVGHAGDALQRQAPLRYLDNPNGSILGIAGVCNEAGNVFGLMPHPERAARREQYPGWRVGDEPAGLTIFRNAMRRARGEV